MANKENRTEGVTRLELDGREIILVGTAHVSKESAELAEAVIEKEKPDKVCVELCALRHQSIRNSEQWRQMDIVKVVKEKKSFLLLANMMLTSFQKRIGKKLGVRPGEEMIRALDAAENVGADICLADREITVTLSRTWRGTRWWNKIKLFFQLILSMGGIDDIDEQAVEEMKKEDILQSLLSELEKSHPSIRRILIDERDQYMAHKIRNAGGQKVVAVVGAGHVPGIKKYLYEEIDPASLETVPPKGRGLKVFKWLLPALIILIFVVGFFSGGAEAGKSMLVWWLLANAVFAGLGTVAAFGHPATIVSAVAAAPLTSLNPMLAAGWVAGLVEAYFRKPKVADLEDLSTDILSIRGFWRNNVTRILLVVVFANLGSTVGTFVALPLMVKAMGI
ncbi:MAG: TraB/GumN family protein [Desulfobacteraceae bacterium]|nr:TraB/GumN family protein [Desulfobacteraceae bacterium]